MAVAQLPEPHPFVPRRADSKWLGPPEETCHWCGCDPRNIVHEPPFANAFEQVLATELHAFDQQVAAQVAAGTHDGLGQPLRFRGHDNEPPHPDETLIAQVALLRDALKGVLKLIDLSAFAWPEQQEALWRANAALVETEEKR